MEAPPVEVASGSTDPECDASVENEKQGWLQALATILGLCAAGLWFGALFERSHVFEPTSIRQQFIFQKWLMVKMFMGAVAGAAFSFCLILQCRPARFQLMRKTNCSTSYPCVIVGCMLLGFGMCISGACPGMVLPQVGTFVDSSGFTLLGGFTGALVANLLVLAGVFQKLQKVNYTSTEQQMKAEYADLRFGLEGKTLHLMCGFGVFAGAVALVLEIVVPFRGELLNYNGGGWRDTAFPPSLCGLGIGCTNIMTSFLVEETIGSATAYAQLMGHAVITSKTACGPSLVKVYWQVPYLSSAVLGAFLSAKASDNFPSQTPGIGEEWVAFLGGFVMLFGSRLACGCTSGHGIASMPMLNIKSIIGCCAMFGGGIALAVVLETQDALSLE